MNITWQVISKNRSTCDWNSIIQPKAQAMCDVAVNWRLSRLEWSTRKCQFSARWRQEPLSIRLRRNVLISYHSAVKITIWCSPCYSWPSILLYYWVLLSFPVASSRWVSFTRSTLTCFLFKWGYVVDLVIRSIVPRTFCSLIFDAAYVFLFRQKGFRP